MKNSNQKGMALLELIIASFLGLLLIAAIIMSWQYLKQMEVAIVHRLQQSWQLRRLYQVTGQAVINADQVHCAGQDVSSRLFVALGGDALRAQLHAMSSVFVVRSCGQYEGRQELLTIAYYLANQPDSDYLHRQRSVSYALYKKVIEEGSRQNVTRRSLLVDNINQLNLDLCAWTANKIVGHVSPVVALNCGLAKVTEKNYKSSVLSVEASLPCFARRGTRSLSAKRLWRVPLAAVSPGSPINCVDDFSLFYRLAA